MSPSVDISIELTEWASLAGYRTEQGSRTRDGRTLLWTRQGEIRVFISHRSDGLLIIATSERMSEEQFALAATSLDAIERHLFGRFGLSIRGADLPLLHYPSSAEEVSTGYRIEPTSYGGRATFALTDSNGSLVAIASGDELVAYSVLAELSLFLAKPVEAIKASYLDPSGKPLFRPRQMEADVAGNEEWNDTARRS